MNAEKIVQVPLTEAAKSALEARADANGRAVGREAAQILNKTLLRNAQKEAK